MTPGSRNLAFAMNTDDVVIWVTTFRFDDYVINSVNVVTTCGDHFDDYVIRCVVPAATFHRPYRSYAPYRLGERLGDLGHLSLR